MPGDPADRPGGGEVVADGPDGEPWSGRPSLGEILRGSHVWLGLLVAIPIIAVSLTGILLNHTTVLGLGSKGPPSVSGSGDLDTAAPINDLLRAGLLAGYEAGARTVTRTGVQFPPTGPGDIDRAIFRPSTGTAQVRLTDPRHTEVVLDWATTEMLDVSQRGDISLDRIHSGEALDQRAVVLSDIVAIVIVILVVGGVILWIRRIRLRRVATGRHDSRWVRFNWKLHLIGGLAVAVYAIILCVTGVILNHKREWGFMNEPPRVLEEEFVARFEPLPLPTLVDWAIDARGGAAAGFDRDDVRFVDYRPLRGYAKVRFNDGETEVIIDAYETKVLAISHRRDRWIEDLHSGVRFGSAGVLLSDLTAIGLIVLTVNGLYVWVAPAWRGRVRIEGPRRE